MFAAAPGAQLEVFNSAAYAQLWQDSASVAQSFTTQVSAGHKYYMPVIVCSKYVFINPMCMPT